MPPTQRILLYEDTVYQSVQEDEETNKEDRRIRMDMSANGPGSASGSSCSIPASVALGAMPMTAEPAESPGKRRNRGKANPDSNKKPRKPHAEDADKGRVVKAADTSFAKTHISNLAPLKLELQTLRNKTGSHEHLYPTHVLTFAGQAMAKIDEVYVKLESVLKGDKHLAEILQGEKSSFEAELKHLLQEGTSAIERLHVQVR